MKDNRHTSASNKAGRVAGTNDSGAGLGAADSDLKRCKVENILALHLAQELSTLHTSRLVQVGGNSARGGTRSLENLDVVMVT